MYTVEEGIEQRGIYHLTQLIGLARLQCQKPLYQLCRAIILLAFLVRTHQRREIGLEALAVHVG
jgi:hypothetical protein